MRPLFVIVLSPCLDEDSGFTTTPEPFPRKLNGKALISELPIEVLIEPVLPRLPRRDKARLDALSGKRAQYRERDEPGTVIAADDARRAGRREA